MDPWFQYDDILTQEFTQNADCPIVSEVQDDLASFETTFQPFDILPPSPEDNGSSLINNMQNHSIGLTENLDCVNPCHINPFEYSSLSRNSECYYPISPNPTLSEASTPEISNSQGQHLKNKHTKNRFHYKLHPNHYALLFKSFDKDAFPRMSTQDINLEYLRQTGFNDPIIFPSVDTQNTDQLTLSKIAILVGNDCPLHIVDVFTQKQLSNKMTMKQWQQYMRQKPSERSRIYDVLSFEVSTTKLALYVRKPDIVRDLDLVNIVWPPSAFASGDFPRVDTYCQMSAENSYIDFHIEFGGSSAYYNILDGYKVFYLIPPSQKHWDAYVSWLIPNGKKRDSFLPDMVDKCYRVEVHAKETIIIPSGWIYAVETPCDTIAISGNFLTFLHIQSQIYINELEVNLGIEREFQFPCFESIMWYTAVHFYFAFPDSGPRDGIDDMLSIYETGPLFEVEKFTSQELHGFEELLNYIYIRAQILRECDFIVDIDQKNVQIQENNGFEIAWAMIPPLLEEICVDFVKKFGAWFTYHHGRSIYMPFLYSAQKSNSRKNNKKNTPEKVIITCHRPKKRHLFSTVLVHTRKSFIEACKSEEERSMKRERKFDKKEEGQKGNYGKLINRSFYSRSNINISNATSPFISTFSKAVVVNFIQGMIQNSSFVISLNSPVIRFLKNLIPKRLLLPLIFFSQDFFKNSSNFSNTNTKLKLKASTDFNDHSFMSQGRDLILHPHCFLKRFNNLLWLTKYFSLKGFYRIHCNKIRNERLLQYQLEEKAFAHNSSSQIQDAKESMTFDEEVKNDETRFTNNFSGFSTLFSSPSSNDDSSFLEDYVQIADTIPSTSKQNYSKRKLNEQDTNQEKKQLKTTTTTRPARTSARIKSTCSSQMKNSKNLQSAIDSHFHLTKPVVKSIKDDKHIIESENRKKRHLGKRNSKNLQFLDDQDQDNIYDFVDEPPPKIRMKIM
ncbi:jmjc domain chromatin associated protein Epe1 [Schizosaccharomyces cryophilus OY26]|uniref:[histone H3]-dimethyl-L-lysine(36) demethylase n=1 Tax=Schizosaccharomyces cryophilus (strain OY26 / ATCC MYA-4695 / CBS 11777 / NBRC 106824 / NRRL Y48691) TaxID=653667 RepID=S9XEB0_SCHCR|nr:jmjc domain chromatin associated protein Epe1 [Schizosaccharomyces cryophilus OY26]EPY52116.1 jmjc domain chromatin associated protein Epe1 [Schizosaccharomyces cryophilus OY26]